MAKFIIIIMTFLLQNFWGIANNSSKIKNTGFQVERMDATEVVFFQLFLNNVIAFQFQFDPVSTHSLLSELIDNNGQRIRLYKQCIVFDESEFVFFISENRVVVVSPYDFCKIFLSSNMIVTKLTPTYSFRVKTYSKYIYLYCIDLPKNNHKVSLYQNMIIGYEPSQEFKDIAIEVHYWIDSFSSYFVSNYFKSYVSMQFKSLLIENSFEIKPENISDCSSFTIQDAIQSNHEIYSRKANKKNG